MTLKGDQPNAQRRHFFHFCQPAREWIGNLYRGPPVPLSEENSMSRGFPSVPASPMCPLQTVRF